MGRNVTLMGCEAKQEKKELKKHIATIHCSNTLSLLQRKVTNALLYHAYKELMLKNEHEITVKQLCRLIGYQGNNHAVIKDALKGLISTVIEWNLINDETGAENWTASSILASVSLEGPLCYYAYSPRMKQLLHSPSMFGKIDLVIQSKFRSSYGLALYENCIRYRGLPKTKWFDIELFKKLMGVPVGKYDIFRDFKRRVLDKAVDEVNSYSDLIISVELVREGRKVVRMRFNLKERAKKTRLGRSKKALQAMPELDPQLTPVQEMDLLPANQPMLDALRHKLTHEIGFSDLQAMELLQQYDPAFIAEKIAIIESSSAYQQRKIMNLPGYLLVAIKQNYKVPAKKKSEPEIDELQVAELKVLKKEVEAIWSAYHTYRDKKIQETITLMADEQKEKFMMQFYDFAGPTMEAVLQIQRKKYNRDNVLDSPQVQALLRQFAIRELDFLTLTTLEEFVSDLPDEKISAWQKFKSYDPEHPFLRPLGAINCHNEERSDEGSPDEAEEFDGDSSSYASVAR